MISCIISGIVSFFATFFLGVCIHDTHSIKTVRYHFKTKRIKKNLRIAVLADLHGKDFGDNNKKLIEAIDSEKPDIIIMAGDIVSAKVILMKDRAIDICKQLAEKYPIYYGIGNHENRLAYMPEQFGYHLDEYTDTIEGFGVNVLNNKRMHLDEYGIDIAGLNLPKECFKKIHSMKIEDGAIAEYTGMKQGFEILIAHNPEYFESYCKADTDLVFSGHLHGGIMKLPGGRGFFSPKFRFFPKYAGGLFKNGKAKMVVSRGLGSHTIPLRLFNPSELVIVDLNRD